MSKWRPNTGYDPNRDLPVGCPRILRVHVRLRNGSAPPESWPCDTGKREQNTRWTLQNHPFDIVEWKHA